MTPSAAFITFRNPFASFLANKLRKYHNQEILNPVKKLSKEINIFQKDTHLKILGKNIGIEETASPTDVNYENYATT